MNSLFYAFAITSVVISIGSLVTQILCLRALRHVDWYSKHISIWTDLSQWHLEDIKNKVCADNNSPLASYKAGLTSNFEDIDDKRSSECCAGIDSSKSIEG